MKDKKIWEKSRSEWISEKMKKEMSKEDVIMYYKKDQNKFGWFFVFLVLLIYAMLFGGLVYHTNSVEKITNSKMDFADDMCEAMCESHYAGECIQASTFTNHNKIRIECEYKTFYFER